MKNFSKLKSKLKNDKGMSVTITGLFMIIFLGLLSIFVVDYAKILYAKSLYNQFAQWSTNVAIKQQNAIGGLRFESANVLIEEYLKQRNGVDGMTNETSSLRGGCTKINEYPKITIKYDNKRYIDADTTEFNVTGSNERVPESRKLGFYNKKYTVIQVEVTDVVYNWMFAMFGDPCTEIKVKASAIGASYYDEDDED